MGTKGELYPIDQSEIRKQNRRSIISLVILFAVLFLAVCAIAVGYFLSQISQVRSAKHNELSSIAASKVNEVFAWRNERLADGIRTGTSVFAFREIQTFVEHPQDVALRKEVTTWLESVRSANNYSTYFLFDSSGNVLLQDSAHPEKLEPTDQAEISDAVKNNLVTLSDLHFVEGHSTIRMDLIVPISGNTKVPVAVLLLRINPFDFLYPLIKDWPIESQSAETILIRKDGDTVIYLNDLRFSENAALQLSFPISSVSLPAAKALRGEANPLDGYDYRGVKVLAVAEPVPDSAWLMIAKEDESEVYAPVIRQEWILAVVLVFLLISILSMAFILIRRQRQKLINSLLKSELDQQRLRQKYNLLFDKGNDIVLAFDTTGQIIDANDRAVEIYGYTRAELLTMNALELRANEIRADFSQMMEIVKKEGGKRFEMIHRRKEGSSFPVEVSSRYFEENGKGYFLNIVRDITEQKKNIKLLKDSEAKYRSLVEHASEGIFVVDKAGRFIDVNEQGCNMTGYSKEEILQLTIDKILDSKELAKTPLKIRELTLNKELMVVSERQVIKKNGETFPIEIMAYDLPDGRIQGVVRDISERVNSRKHLEEAARSYRQLFDSNPVPLYVYDASSLDMLDVNDAAVHLYGYSRTELLNLKVSALQAAEKKTKNKTLPLETEGTTFCDCRQVKKDGTLIDVELTSHPLNFENRSARLELAIDVTEKIKAENELKEGLDALRGVIDTSPVAIITTDMQGLVTLWNRAAETIFGWTAEEILGAPVPFVPEISGDSIDSIIKRITQASENVHYEAERQRKDGKLVTVEVYAIPLRDYRDQLKGVLAVLSDVTEFHAVEEANQKLAEERYQLLNRLRTQFNRMPIGFILTDKELNVIDWNPQAEKIFGYSRQEVLGKNQFDLIIPAQSKELVMNVIKNVTRSYKTEVVTHDNITKEGRLIKVEWHNTSLFDESGEFIAIMAMAIDVTEKYEYERKLHESEEKLRAFFESPLVGIIFGDTDGTIFTTNDELLKIIGYSRSDLEAGLIHWNEITPREFSLLDEAAIQQARREGICTPYEKQYIRKDGKRIWVMVGFILIGEDRENSIAYILDISDRKMAEQALIESEADYRGLFTHMLNGLAFCKMIYKNGRPVDFIYLKTNESFERITGLKNTEGRKVSELIPGIYKDNPEIFEIYGRVASGGGYEKFQTFLPGLNVYFSVYVYSPKPDYFVALFDDISEQKRSEKEIQNKQELLNLTGKIGKIGGWEIDVVKNTSSWTEEVALIHDLPPQTELTVEFGINFYSPESRPIISQAVQEAIERARPYDLELEIISAKGVHKLIRTVGIPEQEEGKVVRVRGIFQDITDMKKAEAEILKLNNELEQRVKDRTAELLVANQELESFSYSVSHDLRAPIRAIDGFSQIILDENQGTISPEMARYLEIIRQNTRNMGNLVDDLLAFSHLGRHALQKQTVDTQKLVTEIVESVRAEIKGRQLKFVIGDLPDCQADINLLKQVFINLISNAVKFTRNREHALVEIGACSAVPPDAPDAAKVYKKCYFVRDNGVGFDMRYYDKLFGVFQRLHRSEDYEGTGVGLAIVKRVIEKHGGKVWAESKLNEGAVFYFVLGEEDDYDKKN